MNTASKQFDHGREGCGQITQVRIYLQVKELGQALQTPKYLDPGR